MQTKMVEKDLYDKVKFWVVMNAEVNQRWCCQKKCMRVWETVVFLDGRRIAVESMTIETCYVSTTQYIMETNMHREAFKDLYL